MVAENVPARPASALSLTGLSGKLASCLMLWANCFPMRQVSTCLHGETSGRSLGENETPSSLLLSLTLWSVDLPEAFPPFRNGVHGQAHRPRTGHFFASRSLNLREYGQRVTLWPRKILREATDHVAPATFCTRPLPWNPCTLLMIDTILTALHLSMDLKAAVCSRLKMRWEIFQTKTT